MKRRGTHPLHLGPAARSAGRAFRPRDGIRSAQVKMREDVNMAQTWRTLVATAARGAQREQF
jgi:hypothetical protein